MFILEVFLVIFILLSLVIPGATYNHYFNNSFSDKFNLLFGFILFLSFGTILSIINIKIISNQVIWFLSYLSLIIFSITYLSKKKIIMETLLSLLSINYLIFIMFFVLTTLIRFINPDIIHTEKIMEFMILSSTMNGEGLIPKDLWFHNEDISYYSYGYFIFSSLPLIINLEPEIAYNFILPIVVSLSYLAVCCLLSLFDFEVKSVKRNLFYFLSFLFTFFLAPLIAIFEFLGHLSFGGKSLYKFISVDGLERSNTVNIFWPEENWWWFSISRIINYSKENIPFADYTINEFPAFSIILGDIHPHLLAIPILILNFSLIIFMFEKKIFKLNNIIILNISILITILINPWYLVPIIWFIILNIIFYKKPNIENKLYIFDFFKNQKYLSLKILGIPIITSIIVLVIINPTNQLQFPYLNFVQISSRLIHIFLYWGFPFVILIVFLISKLILSINSRILFYKLLLVILSSSFIVTLLSKSLYLNFELFINYLLVASLFSFFISSVLAMILTESKNKYLLLLLLSNITIIFGTEFIYVVDAFNNRMNTIFKFYFVSFIFINLISIYILLSYYINLSKTRKYITSFCILIILIPSIWWPIASMVTRNIDNEGPNSLNGLSYLDDKELEIISYIKSNILKDQIVLEGVGNSYTKSNFISSATARATILAWPNHQLQWRNDASFILDLENKIEDFYNNPSKDHHIIKTYNISYIIYSDYERLIYKNSDISNFDQFNLIFENDKYALYSIN